MKKNIFDTFDPKFDNKFVFDIETHMKLECCSPGRYHEAFSLLYESPEVVALNCGIASSSRSNARRVEVISTSYC